MPRRLEPMPPNEPRSARRRDCQGRARAETPHVIIVWFSGLYELAGQSITSNEHGLYCVVSYGVYAQPILNGLRQAPSPWRTG